MRQVTIHNAKTHLSRLIEAAMAGEEIVISKGNTPMVRLVPIVKGGFRMALLGSALGPGPDFLASATEDDLAAWEGQPERLEDTGP
ncbi:MAG: type II toxin-antitoxin system prevent-host-death family antitoxin [Alphaproteobacteria bacterium]|nr:type II toxin-antitoxin system prevent-host-death family antitoxin [Alphaproteobacteria bacterium]